MRVLSDIIIFIDLILNKTIFCLRYEMKNMNVTEPYHSSDMDEQIMRLKVITSKLKEAYHGRNVSWIDDGMNNV